MEILKKLSNKELLESAKAESAKARHEINCAKKDIVKANGRLGFVLSLVAEIQHRDIGE